MILIRLIKGLCLGRISQKIRGRKKGIYIPSGDFTLLDATFPEL